MASRDYGQHCGLARALDVLGERWTLLVVRELALGPKRYRDLLEALPGIGTNLLAARLRALASADVVCRTYLPPPAAVQVYELTASGEELRPLVESLGSWGMRLLPPEPGDRELRAAWATLSMLGLARERAGSTPPDTVDLRVGDEQFWVTVGAGEAEVRHGQAAAPAATLRCAKLAFFALVMRRATLEGLAALDEAQVDGDRAALKRVLDVLELPAGHS